MNGMGVMVTQYEQVQSISNVPDFFKTQHNKVIAFTYFVLGLD